MLIFCYDSEGILKTLYQVPDETDWDVSLTHKLIRAAHDFSPAVNAAFVDSAIETGESFQSGVTFDKAWGSPKCPFTFHRCASKPVKLREE